MSILYRTFLLAPMLIFMLISGADAFAATFTVTSTANGTPTDGVSLRWAITQANAANSSDLIAFDIPGMAPHVINLMTALPNCADGIDGTTQPANGYLGTEKRIVVDGSGIVSSFQAGNSLFLIIKGLWLRNFSGTCITNNDSLGSTYIDHCKITNCAGGVAINGSSQDVGIENCTIAYCTGAGIYTNGINNDIQIDDSRIAENGSYGIHHNGVWGHSGFGNQIINNDSAGIKGSGLGNYFYCRDEWISGNQGSGIFLNGQIDYFHAGFCIIGLDSLGQAAMPNTDHGIFHNSTGGSFNIDNSEICANGLHGIASSSTGNALIYGNWIGKAPGVSSPLGNQLDGVNINGKVELYFNFITDNGGNGATHYAGNNSLFKWNWIQSNGNDGLVVNSDSAFIGNYNQMVSNGRNGLVVNGQNCTISDNEFYCNVGKSIELNNTGNANYPAPVILARSANTVTGTAYPGDIVEIFDDYGLCPCVGQGQSNMYMGSTVADTLGNWSYVGGIWGPVSATATNPVTLNTSEFSLCEGINLPAGIEFFAQAATANTAELRWNLPPEWAAGSYDLSRSVDGLNFQPWRARRTAADPNAFADTDQAPMAREVWYRLRYFDQNGQNTASETRRVAFEGLETAFHAWPNPATDQINFAVDGTGNPGTLTLVDAAGRQWPLWSGTTDDDRLQATVTLPPVTAGIYLLSWQDATGTQVQRTTIR